MIATELPEIGWDGVSFVQADLPISFVRAWHFWSNPRSAEWDYASFNAMARISAENPDLVLEAIQTIFIIERHLGEKAGFL